MHRVIAIDKYIWLDFTANNQELKHVNLGNTTAFSAYVFNTIRSAGAELGVGGYLEDRVIYQVREHFSNQNDEARCIHLGIDLWAQAGTPIYSPLKGKIHSFKNNNNFGDYGPTIITEHQYEGKTLYLLYGHLSVKSLEGLYTGKMIEAGDQIAEIGDFPENGDWPPHLHFQVMTDMLGLTGDFPGVCTPKDKEKFARICLNPDFLLGL